MLARRARDHRNETKSRQRCDRGVSETVRLMFRGGLYELEFRGDDVQDVRAIGAGRPALPRANA